MKGIVVHHKPTDGTPILRLEDVPDVDTFGPDEVLVDIRATAVNRADLMQVSFHIHHVRCSSYAN